MRERKAGRPWHVARDSGDNFGILWDLVRLAAAVRDGNPDGLGRALFFFLFPPYDRVPGIPRNERRNLSGPDLGRRLTADRDRVTGADIRAGYRPGVILVRTAGKLGKAAGVEMRRGHVESPGESRFASEPVRPRPVVMAWSRQLRRYSHQAVRALAGAGHVHDATVLVEGHVISFVALQAV